jgi:hypothetical protein
MECHAKQKNTERTRDSNEIQRQLQSRGVHCTLLRFSVLHETREELQVNERLPFVMMMPSFFLNCSYVCLIWSQTTRQVQKRRKRVLDEEDCRSLVQQKEKHQKTWDSYGSDLLVYYQAL